MTLTWSINTYLLHTGVITVFILIVLNKFDIPFNDKLTLCKKLVAPEALTLKKKITVSLVFF